MDCLSGENQSRFWRGKKKKEKRVGHVQRPPHHLPRPRRTATKLRRAFKQPTTPSRQTARVARLWQHIYVPAGLTTACKNSTRASTIPQHSVNGTNLTKHDR